MECIQRSTITSGLGSAAFGGAFLTGLRGGALAAAIRRAPDSAAIAAIRESCIKLYYSRGACPRRAWTTHKLKHVLPWPAVAHALACASNLLAARGGGRRLRCRG